MRKGGGKAKGSSFEREVSKILTKWCSGQDEEYWFWRTPSSGAISTITNGNGELSGDIIALLPEGTFMTSRFSIEVKTGYPKSSFHKHLKGVKNDEIKSFWEQCVNDANRANKLPMLIYKKKQYNALLGISELKGVLKRKLKNVPSITLSWGDGELPICHLYDMEEFLSIITPEDIKSL
jgi:hypothetical protein